MLFPRFSNGFGHFGCSQRPAMFFSLLAPPRRLGGAEMAVFLRVFNGFGHFGCRQRPAMFFFTRLFFLYSPCQGAHEAPKWSFSQGFSMISVILGAPNGPGGFFITRLFFLYSLVFFLYLLVFFLFQFKNNSHFSSFSYFVFLFQLKNNWFVHNLCSPLAVIGSSSFEVQQFFFDYILGLSPLLIYSPFNWFAFLFQLKNNWFLASVDRQLLLTAPQLTSAVCINQEVVRVHPLP